MKEEHQIVKKSRPAPHYVIQSRTWCGGHWGKWERADCGDYTTRQEAEIRLAILTK